MNAEELFEKLIKNKISKEEFERLLEGLEDEDILARYEVYLQSEFEKEVQKHFDQQANQETSFDSNMTVSKKLTPKKSTKTKNTNKYPLAAIIVMFIGVLFSIMFIISQYDNSPGEHQVAKTIISPDLISKSTPKGRKFRMTLDDGSFVHMNSASNITYPNAFQADNRNIEMEGEVYFDIERDESRPFNIKVKDYEIQVLGTSFNIQAYEDEEDFSVTVESGKVKVILDKEGRNSAVLEKNQKLIFNPVTNVTEIVDAESSVELSWRKGILHFDSTPFGKVEKTLERWYGVKIILEEDGLKHKSITGSHKNKNIKSVIEALTFATGTKYYVKDNSIIIKN